MAHTPLREARIKTLYGRRTSGMSYERHAVSTIGRLERAQRVKGDPVKARRYQQAQPEFQTLCERLGLSDNEAMTLGVALRHCELSPYTPEKHTTLPEPARLAVLQKHGEKAAARIDAGFKKALEQLKDLPTLSAMMGGNGTYLHPDVVQLAADLGAASESAK